MRKKEVLVTLLSSATLLTTIQSTKAADQGQNKPHIVFILADDLGWNDISWNNPHVLSPNLEALAKDGVILSQSYVQPVCTPTRAALMTGRYPYTIGRQHGVLKPKQPTGLTLESQLLPEALKEAGYSTHIVGKWHLGFCSWDYVPTSRGFDTFWGYYLGSEDYYHHTRIGGSENCLADDIKYGVGKQAGYDFRNNTKVEYSVKGEYSTYTFASYTEDLLASRDPDDPMFLYLSLQSVHGPLEVPKNYTKPFKYIEDEHRRTKLGMVLAMDEAVGRVTKALKDTGHYNNSVIIFSTDNGAPISAAGNNWPLRGHKGSCWEGGTRGPAFVHSPLLGRKGVISNELIHVTDWFPTIAGLAGGVAPDDIDGLDQWDTIAKGSPSQRTEMVYNILISDGLQASIRMGDYKLLVGKQGDGSWTPPPEGHKRTKNNQEISVNEEIPEKDQVSGKILQELTPNLAINEPKIIPVPEAISGQRLQVSTSSLSVNEPKDIPETKWASSRTPQNSNPNVKIRERKNIPEPKGASSKTPQNSNPNEEISKPKDIPEPAEPETLPGKKLQESTSEPVINETNETFESTRNEEISAPMIPEPEMTGNTLQEKTPDLVIIRELGLDLSYFPVLGRFAKGDMEVQLYNIMEDPEERKELSVDKRDVVVIILSLLEGYLKDYVEPDTPPEDPAGSPKHFDGVWSPGWCEAK